jgi:glycosyltransferase involved in cell wall biosynthesis
MRIWLLNPYGPIPGEGWREYRFTLVARALARRGHDVTWWTSTFAHHFKLQRSVGWKDVRVEPGFTVRLVPSPGYTRNVSLQRVWSEIVFAWLTYRRGLGEPAPDLIVAVDPPQVASLLGVRLARHSGARLAIDVCDRWPEMFLGVVPRWLTGAARVVSFPLCLLRRRNLRRAELVTTVCRTYTAFVKREIGDRTLPRVETVFIGVDQPETLARTDACQAERGTVRRALSLGADDFVAVYAGSLGIHYDVRALVKAAEILANRDASIRVVVAGGGPLHDEVAAAASRQGGGLIYLGIVHAAALWQLYHASDVGLCIYGARTTVAMPVKAYDYLAAGLPIVSSVPGELRTLLHRNAAGIPYKAGDPRSLAEAVLSMASDGTARARMAGNARRLGRQFNATQQYERMAALIGA